MTSGQDRPVAAGDEQAAPVAPGPVVPADELVAVGRVGPARGVHGDVFVEPWTDSPHERFAPGAELTTSTGGTLVVAGAAVSGGKQVVRFDGVSDRAGAEALRGTELFVPLASRGPIEDPDEFYDTDLAGLAVVTAAGERIGTVRDVHHAGAASYLVVPVDGRDRLIPFVAALVPSVDVAGGRVIVDLPDGLLEL